MAERGEDTRAEPLQKEDARNVSDSQIGVSSRSIPLEDNLLSLGVKSWVSVRSTSIFEKMGSKVSKEKVPLSRLGVKSWLSVGVISEFKKSGSKASREKVPLSSLCSSTTGWGCSLSLSVVGHCDQVPSAAWASNVTCEGTCSAVSTYLSENFMQLPVQLRTLPVWLLLEHLLRDFCNLFSDTMLPRIRILIFLSCRDEILSYTRRAARHSCCLRFLWTPQVLIWASKWSALIRNKHKDRYLLNNLLTWPRSCTPFPSSPQLHSTDAEMLEREYEVCAAPILPLEACWPCVACWNRNRSADVGIKESILNDSCNKCEWIRGLCFYLDNLDFRICSRILDQACLFSDFGPGQPCAQRPCYTTLLKLIGY